MTGEYIHSVAGIPQKRNKFHSNQYIFIYIIGWVKLG